MPSTTDLLSLSDAEARGGHGPPPGRLPQEVAARATPLSGNRPPD